MPTLSEADSKQLLRASGIPFPEERVVHAPAEAVEAARALGFPVVLKLGGDSIAHKSERGLVALRLRGDDDVREAAERLLAMATPADGEVHLLVAAMLSGHRELIAGLHRDPQFGMTVMVGIGGVLTEALGDVTFRLVPITRQDALEMVDDLATQALLGEVRGEPAVDREALCEVLLALSEAATRDPAIASVDLNPLIVVDGRPVAVDALVELT
jgi:acetyl-CoA synthetase (ADP-forming)